MNKFIVDIGAIRHNIGVIKEKLNSGVKFCAVVKADAYGHGSVLVSSSISDLVDYFAVANIDEAVTLRKALIEKPILVVGGFHPEECENMLKYDVTQAVSSLTDLKVIESKAKQLEKEACVHIKINTGMNRIGVSSIREFKAMLAFIKTSKHIKLTGVFSHFCCSDSDVNFTEKQNEKFQKYLSYCKGLDIIKHISASYAAVEYPQFNYDMVRIGFSMYGYSYNKKMERLKPALTIIGEITAVNLVKPCEKVGYAGAFVAEKKMQVATVSLGYADGVNFKLSNNGYVKIKGAKCPIIGRVCMDMFMCDVTGLKVHIGDEVVVFDSENNVFEWAKRIGNREYEVLTNFKYKRFEIIKKDG